jgi:hypothetical protein
MSGGAERDRGFGPRPEWTAKRGVFGGEQFEKSNDQPRIMKGSFGAGGVTGAVAKQAGGQRTRGRVERGGERGEKSGPLGRLGVRVCAQLEALDTQGVEKADVAGGAAARAMGESRAGLAPAAGPERQVRAVVPGEAATRRPRKLGSGIERDEPDVGIACLQDDTSETAGCREQAKPVAGERDIAIRIGAEAKCGGVG